MPNSLRKMAIAITYCFAACICLSTIFAPREASSQTVLNFHYLSHYGIDPLPCPNQWGIGGDSGGLTSTVFVGHPPSQYLYFAYNVYEDGVFHNYQVRWEVDTAGVVHAQNNPAENFFATPDGHVSAIELRDPQCSDPTQVPYMSASIPYYVVQQVCDDAYPVNSTIPVRVYCLGAGTADNLTISDLKVGGNCPADADTDDNPPPMAQHRAHALMASLNIEDTPLRYSPPVGPKVAFRVTYNQRESQQPISFSYSNLGAKWTFSWLSYVTDNPDIPSAPTSVFAAGGGTEWYSNFDSGTQSYSANPQSHAILVRTSSTSFERRFPDGSKQVFALSDGATSFPRKIFMTQLVDALGKAVTIGYDGSFRVSSITDALGQVTTLSYELPDDSLKVTRVTDPFGRFAALSYTNGQLTTITDQIGIQSQFGYAGDFINSLTTPYGTSNFATGQNGNNVWVEMTDPLGGKERVEYRDNAPGISGFEASAPAGFTNSALDMANTYYWDKRAIEMYPPVNGVYDYTKARMIHWAYNSDGSVSGIPASEKAPLENRIWKAYSGQSDTNHAGASANPNTIARVLSDGTTQLSQFEYNSAGNN